MVSKWEGTLIIEERFTYLPNWNHLKKRGESLGFLTFVARTKENWVEEERKEECTGSCHAKLHRCMYLSFGHCLLPALHDTTRILLSSAPSEPGLIWNSMWYPDGWAPPSSPPHPSIARGEQNKTARANVLTHISPNWLTAPSLWSKGWDSLID